MVSTRVAIAMFYFSMVVAFAAAASGFNVSTTAADELTQSDMLGVQMAMTGGTLQADLNTESRQMLTLNGVGEHTLVVEDPTDASTARLVEHLEALEEFEKTLPKFAVLLTKHDVGFNALGTTAEVQFVSLNVHEVVKSNDGSNLFFRVEVISQDVTNLTGTSGVMPPRSYFDTEYAFPAGMLLWDLAPESVDGELSLKYLADNHGLDSGPVPVALEGDTVGAQGLFTTWFLGPFNAWAWVCCAYKIPEHLLIGWVSPFSYVTLFLCCV